MSPADQVQALLERGLAELAGVSSAEFAGYADALPDEPAAVVVVHPALVPTRGLASLLRHQDKSGFVVQDMTDLEEFTPIAGVTVPESPLYLIHEVERGDDMRNWSPNEALPALTRAGRTPLTVQEGVSWLLQQPKMLEPNHCFMTIGSRKVTGTKLDARTPAIWISGGTGHDGRSRRGAPKVGWCWAGNRHTWLGFASARHRT